jgi:micrococcal nuclease
MSRNLPLIAITALAAIATFSANSYVASGLSIAAVAAQPKEASPAEAAQKTRLRDLAGVVLAYTGERVAASAPTYYVDADTFDLPLHPFKGWTVPVRIRLMNVNAPETRSPKCAREKQLAAEAKMRVKAIMDKPGAKIELSTLGGYDEYDRYLATVTIDGNDLGETLVDAGLARVWTEKHQGQTKDYWCAASTDEAGADPRQ